ncbi:hypothetical protein L211DRAFT_637855 [Terfezia boudieri ATCC MYA-4762]|uniref:Uncharacterized protein n=1 Tax=Terfezia boudieri ATCC MYA-4762 TaxID=1051890 RepID=A0A3N4L8X6_9PEZI|nr:hypothetical protein L211DRAFT_637855 [Terfezia boudieri ATCC MYA-4762]
MLSQPAIHVFSMTIGEDHAFASFEEQLSSFHIYPYRANQRIPSVKCHACDTLGIEVYVIKGKICPRCGAHCG